VKKKIFLKNKKKHKIFENIQKIENLQFFREKNGNLLEKFVKTFYFVFKNISFGGNHQLKPTNIDRIVHLISKHGEEFLVPTISGALARPGG
jgi:hypothetical protein